MAFIFLPFLWVSLNRMITRFFLNTLPVSVITNFAVTIHAWKNWGFPLQSGIILHSPRQGWVHSIQFLQWWDLGFFGAKLDWFFEWVALTPILLASQANLIPSHTFYGKIYWRISLKSSVIFWVLCWSIRK